MRRHFQEIQVLSKAQARATAFGIVTAVAAESRAISLNLEHVCPASAVCSAAAMYTDLSWKKISIWFLTRSLLKQHVTNP